MDQFRLVSCKFVHCYDEALKLYILSAEDPLTDLHEIFEPFDGELYLMDEIIKTQEVCICIWIWNNEELLDVNPWPGDVEHGAIGLKIDGHYILFCLNGAGDFDIKLEDHPFGDTIWDFMELRRSIFEDYDIKGYLASPVGQRALEFEAVFPLSKPL